MRRVPLILVLAAAGCASDPDTGTQTSGLAAQCTVDVVGVGTIDVETDYLPHVVQCENGAAAPTALEAQAITARSYLYYRLATGNGTITDGQGDQVYSCGATPAQQHVDAVAATAGQVLQYQGTQVATFFVAGAHQTGPSCQGGTDDPTNTEKYVTYNAGKSGDAITQTTLGFVDPSNHANRGCMSQNGSDCLAKAGDDVDTILKFYYGDDIEKVQATGACVTVPGSPDAGSGSGTGTGTGDAGGGCSTGGGGTGFLALAISALIARRRR